MTQEPEIDIGDIIDAQTLRVFNIKLLVWSFLMVMADGYDFSAAGFAAPSLIKAWHIQNLAALGPVFSASLVGIALGAPLLGYVADRIGRKTTLITGAVIFGVLTLVATQASGVMPFLILRVLAGIGLGGVMPISIALNTEYAPRRLRATLVTLMFCGFSVGVGLPGFVAAWLVPSYGWQAIFLFGGLFPLVIAACVAFTLPESAKYLVLQGNRHKELVAIVRKLAPSLTIPVNARFVMREETQSGRPSFGQLFAGDLAVKTPLLWVLFATVGMVLYFIQTWSPTLLGSVGVSPAHAAIATTLYQIGSLAGTLALGLPIDRYGMRPLTVALVLAVPSVACLGLPGLSEPVLMGLFFVCGALTIGGQNALSAVAGMIYPSFIRANGVGTCFAIVRVGSIIGTMTAGFLIASKVPMEKLFLITAVPMAIAVIAAYLLGRVHIHQHAAPAAVPQTVEAD
ncbi:MAG TPA: MFS transporter [Pseudolabrys sp.]|nr:MFS transporter [Pseudolabrys sp.]